MRDPATSSKIRRLTTILGLIALCSSIVVSVVAPAGAQRRSAVVEGASKLFVRHGPGMTFPPFARLAEGTTVEVLGIQGEWVRIATPNGQSGFAHGDYLRLLGRETQVPAATIDRTEPADPVLPDGDVAGIAADAEEEADPNTVDDANESRAAEDATEAPAELEATLGADAPPAFQRPSARQGATMADERASIVEEVRRLQAAVEQLERRIRENEPMDDGFREDDGDDGSVSGGAILLSLLGVAVGWYFGGRHGRALERGQRTRIRF